MNNIITIIIIIIIIFITTIVKCTSVYPHMHTRAHVCVHPGTRSTCHAPIVVHYILPRTRSREWRGGHPRDLELGDDLSLSACSQERVDAEGQWMLRPRGVSGASIARVSRDVRCGAVLLPHLEPLRTSSRRVVCRSRSRIGEALRQSGPQASTGSAATAPPSQAPWFAEAFDQFGEEHPKMGVSCERSGYRYGGT